MKKPYVKPEFVVIPSGTPKHKELLKLLKAEEEKKQSGNEKAK